MSADMEDDDDNGAGTSSASTPTPPNPANVGVLAQATPAATAPVVPQAGAVPVPPLTAAAATPATPSAAPGNASIADRLQQAYARNQAMLNEQIAAISKSGEGGINLPLLAIAAGMLGPTKTGSFGESLGAAAQGALGAYTAKQQAESERQNKIIQLRMAQAKMEPDMLSQLYGMQKDEFDQKMRQQEFQSLADYRKAQTAAKDATKFDIIEYNGQKYWVNKTDPSKPPVPLGDVQKPEALRKVEEAKKNWQTLGFPDPSDPKNALWWQNLSVDVMSGGTKINVPIDNRQTVESAQSQATGTERGKRAAALEQAGAKSAETYGRLGLLQDLLASLQTDKLTPTYAQMGAWMQALGIDPAKVNIDPTAPAKAELAQKLTNELVTGSIGAGGFPANNFSDADRNFLSDMFPKISNRPESNYLAIEVMKRVAKKQSDMADAWSDYQEKQAEQNKTADFAQFERQWRRDHKDEDTFADIKNRLGNMGGTPASSSPGAKDTVLPPTSTRINPPQPSRAPTERDIQLLRSNPNLRNYFDEKFGAGAAKRVLGQ